VDAKHGPLEGTVAGVLWEARCGCKARSLRRDCSRSAVGSKMWMQSTVPLKGL
jgi:hypothetical protein